MFEEHNKLTKASYWLLAISSLVGFPSMALVFLQLTQEAPWGSYALVAALTLMLALNTYFAYLIFKRSLNALKLSLWLYALQTIGIEAGSWDLGLSFGMNVSARLVFGSTEVIVNLLALLVFVVIFRAYRSVQGANRSMNYAPSAPDG